MLTIELVPRTVWYSNLRSELSKEQWDFLRRACYRKAEYVCEICGGEGPKWPVECHEIWEFDDSQRTQTLKGLIALCPDCHSVKHIGLAGMLGKGQATRAHLARVNGWSAKQAQDCVRKAFALWEERSQHDWTLDISWIEQHLP